MNNIIALNDFIELENKNKKIDKNGEEYFGLYGIKCYYNNEIIEHRNYKDKNKYKLNN